jgi:hypothetical protein
MKHVVVLIAAGLVAAAIYAVAAPAGEQAVTPKQFAALSKKVKNLTTELRNVEACAFVQAVPVAQFGNPTGNEGYQYANSDGTFDLTTALDVSTASSAQAWVLVTTASCANIINAGKHKHSVLSFRSHHTK